MEDAPDQMFVLAIKDIVDHHVYVSHLTILFSDSKMQVFDKKEMT